jgi:hypothetical protein
MDNVKYCNFLSDTRHQMEQERDREREREEFHIKTLSFAEIIERRQ